MFFNMNVTPVQLDIYIGNQLVQSSQMAMPDQMLAAQFMQVCQNVDRDPQPVHVVMRRWEDEWNGLTEQVERREYKLEYWNKQEVW